jgi:hypothetical protein
MMIPCPTFEEDEEEDGTWTANWHRGQVSWAEAGVMAAKPQSRKAMVRSDAMAFIIVRGRCMGMVNAATRRALVVRVPDVSVDEWSRASFLCFFCVGH